MSTQHIKTGLTSAWVLTIAATGIAADIASPFSLTLLACLAVIPPVVALRFARETAPSLSERIQDAIR